LIFLAILPSAGIWIVQDLGLDQGLMLFGSEDKYDFRLNKIQLVS